MNVQVVYCNHRTASLDVRERLAFSNDEQLELAYSSLRTNFPESELVVLSTCNRVELYLADERPEESPSRDNIARFFSEFHKIPLTQFSDDLIAEYGPDAVRHLFEVASSLDSMVLGESQIVSQVKRAYDVAQRNDACGPVTATLFERSFQVSKRIRSETRLTEGRVSIASVAVGEFAKSIFDQFDDKTVLVIGAGEMAEETLRYLKDEGVSNIVVVNRSAERGRQLAEQWGGTARPHDELDRWMRDADVIVSTTGAARPIVDAARFQAVRQDSADRPVFILDLGAPRDFEPAVGDVDDNVFLFDIDDLEATCEANRRTRAKEIAKAREIIEQATEQFMQEVYHRATGPIVKRLREEWHNVRQKEIQRLFAKLPHLTPEEQQAIEMSIERIVNKLLHPPLETLKEEAREGPPHGLLDALRQLFHLGDS